ncbi:MAG: hypothetical protein AAF998_03360 [Bacteroidota bacterium]
MAAKTKLTKAQRRKKRRQNLLLTLISGSIALIVGEFILRALIFSGSEGLAGLRRPEAYTNVSEDAYWKLYHEFGGAFKPPEDPHPLLGWVGYFDPETYLHRDAKHLGKRRPVLLYGDSFAMCVNEVDCFEDILNQDTAFTRANYLLNYGVGGYGVGQAALLCAATAPRYDRPLVVFSMLTTDIDRTILSVRTGQKPYFALEADTLKLRGYPIYEDAEQYFAEHPPEITSYLYRRFVYSDLNVLPYRIRKRMTGKDYWIEKKQAVNEALIKRVAEDLRAAEIDFVFMVFHFEDDMMSPNSEDNWRDQFFKRVLAENDIPYIWTKGIIRKHRQAHPENSHDAYIIPGNGHPTTLYNTLISAEIARTAARRPWPTGYQRDSLNPRYFESQITAFRNTIRNNTTWQESLQEKAAGNGQTLEEQIEQDAAYLANEKLRGFRNEPD